MLMPVRSREFRPEDALQVSEVDRLVTEDLRKVYRPTDLAVRQRDERTAALETVVAVLDDRVVGVVRYQISGGQLAFLGLGVHPMARRRGVAQALVHYLEWIARDSGCSSMVAHTVRETGNVAVFERLGFLVESQESTGLIVSDRFPTLSEVRVRKSTMPRA